MMLLAVALAVSVATDFPILNAMVFVLVLLVVVDLTLRSPAGVAVLAVVAVWLAVSLPLAGLFPEPDYQGVGLALLALPVAFLSLLLSAYAPWRTATWALVCAALVTVALAQPAPRLHVGPAWVAALLVLAYRWDRARRVVPAESYDSGWVEETPVVREQVRAVAEIPEPRVSYEEPPYEELPYQEEISVEEALAELEDMIGLEPVKRQVRSIAASIEAANLRAEAGVPIEKPMRHSRLRRPARAPARPRSPAPSPRSSTRSACSPSAHVVEAHRADLVGEFLGATAIKTNELVDSALGGVLFIDEAYALVNAADGQPDRFGNEAVQTLLKRAEDDRDHLVIILAGYETQMEEFLDSNPGLASRFGTRSCSPATAPQELLQIHRAATPSAGGTCCRSTRWNCWPTGSRTYGGAASSIELGNGRFVRSLAEAAAPGP